MLATNLKKIRNNVGISQNDLSKIIKVSQQTIGSWEVGRTEPDNGQILALANYFNVSTDYLLGNTDDPTPPFKAPETFQTIPMAPPEKEKTATDEGDGLVLNDRDKEVIERFKKLSYEGKLKIMGYLDSLLSQDNQ